MMGPSPSAPQGPFLRLARTSDHRAHNKQSNDWWFTDPKAPDQNNAAVFIVWIDHDYGDFYNGYYGPLFNGDLRVGYNQRKPGGYYHTLNSAPIQSNWVTLYSDANLVLKFKGFLPNAGQK
jgi:hypothetical protein